MSSRTAPLTLKEAQQIFNEKRRAILQARCNLANAESEYALSLTAYLAVLANRFLETPQ